MATRIFGDVFLGDVLPPLCHQVTSTTVVLGALATRDWRPMHHDHDFAVNRNGTKDIFLNTPNQAAFFERFITDWTGPYGRLGTMRFGMKGSVFPGDAMTISGVVSNKLIDEKGCGWVTLAIKLCVGEDLKTSCEARVAIPLDQGDNPWARQNEEWRPQGKDEDL